MDDHDKRYVIDRVLVDVWSREGGRSTGSDVTML
jgi:hypothetical protein